MDHLKQTVKLIKAKINKIAEDYPSEEVANHGHLLRVLHRDLVTSGNIDLQTKLITDSFGIAVDAEGTEQPQVPNHEHTVTLTSLEIGNLIRGEEPTELQTDNVEGHIHTFVIPVEDFKDSI